jgi:hypothetical protein
VKFTIVRSAADFTGVGPREKPGQGRQMVPGWVPVKSRDKAGRSYWGRFGKSYGVEKQNVEKKMTDQPQQTNHNDHRYYPEDKNGKKFIWIS